MPTCPACGVSVGYEDLGAHLGTCKFVWSEAPERTDRLTERLAGKVRQLEDHLERRGSTVESDTEPVDVDDADGARDDDPNRRTHRLR